MKTVIATTVLVVVMGATYGFSAPGRHGSALRAAREAKEQPLLELRGICMNIMKPIGTKRSIMIRTMMTAMSTMMTTRGTMVIRTMMTAMSTMMTTRGTMVIRTMMTAMSTMMTTRGTMVIRTMMTAMRTKGSTTVLATTEPIPITLRNITTVMSITERGTMVIRTMMTAMRTKGSTTVLATTEPISMMLRKIMAVMSITMVILLSLSPLPHDCFGDNKDDGEGDNDSEKDY
nr:uncharacterized protein LOC113811977 isoform X2 [Penaeus vannamei]